MTWRTAPALCALLALVLAGCVGGGGGGDSLSAATKHGLSMTLKITDSGTTKECTTFGFRTALPDGRPITQGSHACGRAILYGYPLLVQAHSSAESMIIDVPSAGCGTVTSRAGRAAATTLVVRCTSGDPKFRVTIIPAARRLVLTGIPGAAVLSFRHRVCKTGICAAPIH
jgi:hypothetical protein